MTPRFRALLTVTALFAVAGIPVGILEALVAAWRAPQELRDGLGYWSLALGFAIGGVQIFTIIFALIGLVFGLWISAAGQRVGRPSALGRAAWLGILAGIISGIAAYTFAGWGAGETVGSWLAGAASLAAISAAVGGSLAAAYFSVASRPSRLGPPADEPELRSPVPPVAE